MYFNFSRIKFSNQKHDFNFDHRNSLFTFIMIIMIVIMGLCVYKVEAGRL